MIKNFNFKTIFLLVVCTIFFALSFENYHINADSIRPVVNGDYDSYVSDFQNDNNDGYTDSDDVNDPGATVHVQNANQLLQAVGYVKGTSASKTANAPEAKIHKIILDNDISLADATDYPGFATNFCYGHSSMGSYSYLSVNHKNLVIDGQGHTLDMLFNAFAPDSSLTGNTWTLENMKLYGSSWWGPISTNSAFTVNYRNLDYYGSQLIWSSKVPNVKVNIYGSVACHSLLLYKPLRGNGYEYAKGTGGSSSKLYGYLCEGGTGNQQNVQAGDIEFHGNSKYFGESYNGNCLELQGGSKLDNNAKVELHPHGTSAEDGPGGNSAGLYLYQSGSYKSQIIFSNDDDMNIYCDNNDVYNSDGSHYAPNNPNQLSCGFYASSSTDAYLNQGNNSHLVVNSIGKVSGNDPLVNIQSMNAYVAGNNSFEIYSDAQNQYVPSSGVLNTSSSNIDVGDQGTFIMRIKNVPQTNTVNYLLSSVNSIININRPEKVILSNDTYNNNQSNFLNQMSSSSSSTHNYIRIRNSSVNSIIYDSMNNPNGFAEAPGIPAKDILLPLYGNRLYVPGIRLLGGYFNNIQFANAVNKTLDNNKNITAQNFNYVDIKGTPIPNVASTEHNNVNTHNPCVSGKIVDDNGNAIPNAYIKAKLDGQDNFIKPTIPTEAGMVNSNFENYINSYEILYNAMRSYLPKDIGSPTGADLVTNNNFYSTLDGYSGGLINNPIINPDLQKTYFGIANPFFFQKFAGSPYKQFSSGVTMYKANGDLLHDTSYLGMTDSNGNFKIQVPQSVFDSLQKEGTTKSYLDIVPSYNFTDGPAKKVLISYNPLINIKNTLRDITYPDANSSNGNSLNKVFQGGQGRPEDGDTLEFDDTLSNSADNSDVSDASFTQPVPQSIDESTLQISYDGGKSFSKLESNDYSVNQNDDGTKDIVINHINLKSSQRINLAIRGTMKVKNGDSVNNSSINFTPTIVYNDNEYDSGNDNSITFTDNSLNFQPNDIDFGDAIIFKNQPITPLNKHQLLISNVQDNRRDNSVANIYVQQNSNKFYNESDDSKYFEGDILYNGNDLVSSPVQMFEYNNSDNMYLDTSRYSLQLLPDENYNNGGSYKTQLTWSVNYGIN